MSNEYICDGCGKRARASIKLLNGKLNPFITITYIKPHGWLQRGDRDGIQDACSADCAREVSIRRGRKGVVLK